MTQGDEAVVVQGEDKGMRVTIVEDWHETGEWLVELNAPSSPLRTYPYDFLEEVKR